MNKKHWSEKEGIIMRLASAEQTALRIDNAKKHITNGT